MRTFKILTMGVYLLFAVSLLYGQSTWKHADVSATDKQELEADVAVDSYGTAHIVFLKKTRDRPTRIYEIYYANTVGNSLSTPVQITNLGVYLQRPVVAVDHDDNIHIAVENGNNSSVVSLNNVGGEFSPVEQVSQDVGLIDMDIDEDGKAHIVYDDVVDSASEPGYVWHIFYATNVSGTFEVNDLGDFGFDGVWEPTIAEKDGIVHIAVHGSIITYHTNIYYINNNNSEGSFNTDNPTLVFDNGQSNYEPSISVDNMGTVHVVHEAGNNNSQPGIFHSFKENSSEAFLTEAVLDSGFYGTAHALGPLNEVGIYSIGIYSRSSDRLIFTTNKSGIWVSGAITSPGSGDRKGLHRNGIAIDGNGYVHVVGTIDRASKRKHNIDVRYHTNNPNFMPGGGGGGVMHVQRIDMSAKKKGSRWNAVAEVLILDEYSSPVQDATVSGDWSGIVSGTGSANTDAQGIAILNSPKTKSSGNITFTVADVTKPDWTYDETDSPSGFITGPPSAKSLAERAEPETPTEFALLGNYPNPFNPETSIQFSLSKTSLVEITIYNTLGKVIRRLVSEEYSAGEHSVKWDGQNAFGEDVASGIYLYKLQAGNLSQVKKMSLLR